MKYFENRGIPLKVISFFSFSIFHDLTTFIIFMELITNDTNGLSKGYTIPGESQLKNGHKQSKIPLFFFSNLNINWKKKNLNNKIKIHQLDFGNGL